MALLGRSYYRGISRLFIPPVIHVELMRFLGHVVWHSPALYSILIWQRTLVIWMNTLCQAVELVDQVTIDGRLFAFGRPFHVFFKILYTIFRAKSFSLKTPGLIVCWS